MKRFIRFEFLHFQNSAENVSYQDQQGSSLRHSHHNWS